MNNNLFKPFLIYFPPLKTIKNIITATTLITEYSNPKLKSVFKAHINATLSKTRNKNAITNAIKTLFHEGVLLKFNSKNPIFIVYQLPN